MDEISIAVIASLPDEWAEAVNAELRQFNQTENRKFWATLDRPECAAQPLNVLAFDPQRRVLGGLLAETRLAWLKINVMSVIAQRRRQGIGASLVARAECEAICRGCKYAYVDTMDYQAPDFYQKLGYQLTGRLDDWDSHGHAKLFFVKKLSQLT